MELETFPVCQSNVHMHHVCFFPHARELGQAVFRGRRHATSRKPLFILHGYIYIYTNMRSHGRGRGRVSKTHDSRASVPGGSILHASSKMRIRIAAFRVPKPRPGQSAKIWPAASSLRSRGEPWILHGWTTSRSSGDAHATGRPGIRA